LLCFYNLSSGTSYLSAQAKLASEAGGSQTSIDCELRVVWGGENPRPYSGEITIANGTIKFVRNLSLQQDSIGTISNTGVDRVELRPHSSSTYGGVDIAVKGKPNSLLSLRIDDPLGGASQQFEIPLEDLFQGEWLHPLDDRGSRLAISRQVADRIRVTSDPHSRILLPRQSWSVKFTGNRTRLFPGGASAEVRIID